MLRTLRKVRTQDMMTQICEAKVLCCERYVSNNLAIEWNKTHVKRFCISQFIMRFTHVQSFFHCKHAKVHLPHCRGNTAVILGFFFWLSNHVILLQCLLFLEKSKKLNKRKKMMRLHVFEICFLVFYNVSDS